MLLGILVHAFEEILVEGMHAALALDGLHHDGADIRILFTEVDEGRKVIRRGIEEAFGQREEILMENVLPGRSERRDGAAVEAIDEGHDDVAILAVLVDGVLARTFDGTFIGFCAGVREEDLLHAGFFAKQFGKLCIGLRIVQVRDMVQCVELLFHSGHPWFVGNAEDVDTDPAAEVNVFLTVLVGKDRSLAAHKADRVTVVGMCDVFLIFFDGIHI